MKTERRFFDMPLIVADLPQGVIAQIEGANGTASLRDDGSILFEDRPSRADIVAMKTCKKSQ